MPEWLNGISGDLCYAARGLCRNSAFAISAIVASALGIGATTAVFSAVDRILFRALPYAGEDRLVSVGLMAPLDTSEFMFADEYFDLRRNPGPFEAVTSFQAGVLACDLTEQNPLRLACARVEANFLRTLGIAPWIGRSFTAVEDRRNGPPVALISYGLWNSRFGGDPRVLGRLIPLDGVDTTIVGVLPANFEMPTLARADVLMPEALNEATERQGRVLRVFARLKAGIGVGRAVAQLQPHFQRALATAPPQFRKEVSLRVRPIRDRQVGDARAASIALFGSVWLVLLIACANVANLLLARGAARRREIGVRAALGASRARLVRQSLIESLLLAVAGGIGGCVLASALVRLFRALAPAGLPWAAEMGVDARALLFAAATATGAGLLFGAAPALQMRAGESLRSARSIGAIRSSARAALVTAQVALSVALLAGAGLLLRSLWKMENVPLGMETEHVVTARFVLGPQRYGGGAAQLAFFNTLEQRLRAIPGVEAVAISDSVPPSGATRGRLLAAIRVEGQPQREQGTGGMVAWRYVTPGYFPAMGIRIIAGRGFTDQDRAPDAYSLILNQRLARLLFPSESPIGKHILRGPQGQWFTVVGVAADAKDGGPLRASEPEYYVPRKAVADFTFRNQEPPLGWRAAAVIARTPLAPPLAATSLRRVLAALDPTLPVELETMEQRMRQVTARPRFSAAVLGLFAGLGLLLAAVGLYGVVSFMVAERTREIGVRMALGATPAAIVRMVIRGAGLWTALGVALGLGAFLALARLLHSLLFQVQPLDVGSLAAAVTLLCAVALIAAAGPARRAARFDPSRSLRQE